MKKAKKILDVAMPGRESKQETSKRVYLKTINDILETSLPGEPLESGKDVLAETIQGVAESIARVEGRNAEEVLKEIEELRKEAGFEKSLQETVRQGYQTRFDKFVNASFERRGRPKSLDDIDRIVAELSELAEREGWEKQMFKKMRDVAIARWTAEILGEKHIWETIGRELDPSGIEQLKTVLDIRDPIEMLQRGQELASLMTEVSPTAAEAWRRLFIPAFRGRPKLLQDSEEALSQQISQSDNKIALIQKEWARRHFELRMQNVPKGRENDAELVRQVEENRKASKEHNRAAAALHKQIESLKEERAAVTAIRERLKHSVNDPEFKKTFAESMRQFGVTDNTMWGDFTEAVIPSQRQKSRSFQLIAR